MMGVHYSYQSKRLRYLI